MSNEEFDDLDGVPPEIHLSDISADTWKETALTVGASILTWVGIIFAAFIKTIFDLAKKS